jgi:hypothetical protein
VHDNRFLLQMRLTLTFLMLLLIAAEASESVVINRPEIVNVGTNAVVRPLGPATVCGNQVYFNGGGGAGQFLVIKCSPAEHFTWHSVTGQVYAIQCSTNLPNWTNTGTKIIGRGGSEEWYEPITGPCMFHRLVLSQ